MIGNVRGMTDDGTFAVNFGTGRRFEVEDIRQQKRAFMPDGEHAWVINTVYALDNPELSMNEMELGSENFVGVTTIHCLLCGVEYTSEIRHYKCPQKWQES